MAVRIEDRDLDWNRPADGAGYIRIPVARLRGVRSADQRVGSRAVVEIVLRVELLMALVPGGAAMKFGAAVLGDHVDLRSAFETVLGGVGLRLAFDRGDRVPS